MLIITLEQVNTSVSGRKKKTNLNQENFDGKCCKFSLYANDSCDEHAVYFWLKWRAMFLARVLSLASSSTVHVFPVVANTCTKPVQKQLVEYDTKSKYPKEYSTTDNVESEKAFGV